MAQAYYRILFTAATSKIVELYNYIENADNTDGFIVPKSTQKDRLEFSVGLTGMVMILEIDLKTREEKYSLKTFRLEDDMNDYGKKKAVHLPDLDIERRHDGKTKFVTESKVELNFDRQGDRWDLTEKFVSSYIERLLIVLDIEE